MKFKLGKRTRFRELKVGDWFIWDSLLSAPGCVYQRLQTCIYTKVNVDKAISQYPGPQRWVLGPSEKVFPIEVVE